VMIKRFILRYGLDIFFGIISLIAVAILSIIGTENLAVILRKIAVFGIWSVVTYISRISKIGIINWDENPQNKIYYTFCYLICSAIIFALA